MLKRCVIDGLWLSIPTAMLTFRIMVEVVGYLWLPIYLLTTPWNIAVFNEEPAGWRNAIFLLGAHVNGCLLTAVVRRGVRKIESASRPAAGDGAEAPRKSDESAVWAIIVGGFALLTVVAIAAFVYVLRG